MRSRLRVAATIAGAVVVLLAGIIRTSAVTGPEPPTDFELFIRERPAAVPNARVYDRTEFAAANGWDFGDRSSYACAFVEHFTGGQLDFEVHVEVFDEYPVPIEINDRNGLEGDEGTFDCGDGLASAPNVVYSELEYGDHIPHGDATGAADLVFYRNGETLLGPDGEPVMIDYSDGDVCDEAYWTPGNEPGEAVFWWDEDGPSTADGHSALPCEGNGPGAAAAIAVANVQQAALDVGYCVLDPVDGDLCYGDVPGPTGPTVTTGPSGPTGTGPTGPTAEPVCYSGTLVAEDGSGRTLEARVCE